MRRGVVGTLFMVLAAATSGVAYAASNSEASAARAACRIAAMTWDGSATAGGATARAVVAAKPFPDLTSARDKRLRTLVSALVANPDSEVKVQEFGAWCKKRYPKDPVIRQGKYEVSILARKGG